MSALRWPWTRSVSVEPISADLLRDASYTAEALKVTISGAVLTIGPSRLPLEDESA